MTPTDDGSSPDAATVALRSVDRRSRTTRNATARTLAVFAAIAMTSCGTTFVDETVATPDTSPSATTTTTTPIDTDAPLDELLTDIETLMFDLDQRIIDNDDSTATLDRINELWRVAEPRIRADDPDDVFNFAQAIDLARTGVERRRPADASKGYKIITDVIDAYLGRP